MRWVDDVPLAELPAIYAMADVVVNFPSMDAFPVTLMEAAACGRPIVTGLLPAYRGSFVEKYSKVVPPGDSAALADALVAEVNGDPREKAEALAAARGVAEREYDESVTTDRFLRIYGELTARP